MTMLSQQRLSLVSYFAIAVVGVIVASTTSQDGVAHAYVIPSVQSLRIESRWRPRPNAHQHHQHHQHGQLRVPRLKAAASTAAAIDSNDDDGDSEENETNGYNWSPKVRNLALPALVGMLADPLLSLMDTAYVGRVGAVELAALGACTSIFHLAFNVFRATTAATTSLVGSATNEEEKQQIIQTSLGFGVTLGMVLLITLRALGPQCLGAMGVPRDSPLFKPALSYLSTRLFAAPAVLTIVVSEGAFRGYGNTRIPLLASTVASVINLILDPILMFPLGLGVRGAAAATAAAQMGSAGTYLYFLNRRGMLPPRRNSKSSSSKTTTTATNVNTADILRTIIGANIAMVCKQGSLLLGWAYATARATRIGQSHVAAHQVALSCWLVCALLQDGSAVAGQVLMSQSKKQLKRMRSLASYMGRYAVAQGLLTTLVLLSLSPVLPTAFTTDLSVRKNLVALMPHLAWQQLLISCTLVAESLAVGGKQFRLLAIGTSIATVLAAWQIHASNTIVSIWSRGIVTLFAGRLVTALVATGLALRGGDSDDDNDGNTKNK
mmetsp:Transcript_13593/g.38938  ORF Transcript_13593/g.38938 Transcript_13593/m.38938 type:complete len:550 (+) Transcript_13593:49-1698(+)